MRYIGGKSLMLDNIASVIETYTADVLVVTDVFSGTGVVSQNLKSRGYAVNSNDILYFSYVLNKGILEMNEPISDGLRDIVEYLNNLSTENTDWFDIESAFIYQNYSPHGGCKRMYFQCDNALKIDLVRQGICISHIAYAELTQLVAYSNDTRPFFELRKSFYNSVSLLLCITAPALTRYELVGIYTKAAAEL